MTSQTPRQWYRVEAKGTADVADIYVFDQIGQSYWNDDAVTATRFIADLQALPESVKTVRVHVNSPGGSVFDATAIANALRAQREEKARTIDVRIDGIAASAATIITSAGNPVRMADNAMMMIHEPSAIEIGNAKTMRKMADVLDAVRDAIVATYRWVSSKASEELTAMMAATTWMDAQQALDAGLVTEITPGAAVTASFRADALTALGEVPEAFRARVQALIAQPTPSPAPPEAMNPLEVIKACKAAGCADVAEDLVSAGATSDQVQARLTEVRAATAASQARAQQITALCETSKVPEIAAAYIAGGMSVEHVKAQLTILTAKLDQAEIDGGLLPDHRSTTKARINTSAVYAALNGLANKE